ncbi:DUF1491 family protein [Methylosinus sp. H3A]|uniref:DUF1491 family protein n=1 Tax=Methylosinus sp. H3A TaxID=2785786 RepID=UPI0018C22A45|nr:DUF1491 family protein [Methylosinus sp. H3A]MBG0809195.1 DUF1491 family protein [Methylosinus sp. H3A]
MRLRSDFFVSALIRRAETAGAVAMLRRRGSEEAGSIFVKIDRLDGRAALLGPAPQSFDLPDGVDRLFARLHAEEWVTPLEAEERAHKEIVFDPDLWLVEIEDRDGRSFVDIAAA